MALRLSAGLHFYSYHARTRKNPIRQDRASSLLMLAVPALKWGDPHTTIGATAFHFWGSAWGRVGLTALRPPGKLLL